MGPSKEKVRDESWKEKKNWRRKKKQVHLVVGIELGASALSKPATLPSSHAGKELTCCQEWLLYHFPDHLK